MGSVVSSPSGIGAKPRQKTNLVHAFWKSQNTSACNIVNRENSVIQKCKIIIFNFPPLITCEKKHFTLIFIKAFSPGLYSVDASARGCQLKIFQVKYSNVVRGGALAENEFGAFLLFSLTKHFWSSCGGTMIALLEVLKLARPLKKSNTLWRSPQWT